MIIDNQVVRNFLHELTGRQIRLEDDESLLDAGLLDSFSMVKLLLFIEESYKVTISDDELLPENFETIDGIARFLEQKIH